MRLYWTPTSSKPFLGLPFNVPGDAAILGKDFVGYVGRIAQQHSLHISEQWQLFLWNNFCVWGILRATFPDTVCLLMLCIIGNQTTC